MTDFQIFEVSVSYERWKELDEHLNPVEIFMCTDELDHAYPGHILRIRVDKKKHYFRAQFCKPHLFMINTIDHRFSSFEHLLWKLGLKNVLPQIETTQDGILHLELKYSGESFHLYEINALRLSPLDDKAEEQRELLQKQPKVE